VFCNLSCPHEGETEVGEFGNDVGEEASTELEGFVQDAEGVLAHFLTGDQFGQGLGDGVRLASEITILWI
jgi:hypothetical protein